MTIRTLYLPALIVAAVLMACVVVVLALSEKAEATFPGKNGRIAYWNNFVIYTIDPNGSAKTKVTNTSTGGDTALDYSPDGKKITYTDYEGVNGNDTEIYTIKVDGSAKTNVTNNNRDDEESSYSPDGKKIAYSTGKKIYTINVGGGGKSKVTEGSNLAWGSRP